MGDVIDSLQLGLGVLQFAIMLGFLAYWFTRMGRFSRELASALNPTFRRDPPGDKVLLRRLFCSHREISRVRNAYGLQYTACTRCGIDVNAGKRKEEWR